MWGWTGDGAEQPGYGFVFPTRVGVDHRLEDGTAMARPLSNAQRGAAGARFENVVKAHLENAGYFCLRSAGSASPVDVVAFGGGQVVFVQAKRSGRIAPSEWNAFLGLARAVGAVPVLAESGETVSRMRLWRLTGDRLKRSHTWPREPWRPLRGLQPPVRAAED